ncbi:MAG: hypothetical protein H6757_02415 [Candidatus Omnitrophica bacterium]|nr:hypothetical protein [Candidatus Omnitrophota bacterium]
MPIILSGLKARQSILVSLTCCIPNAKKRFTCPRHRYQVHYYAPAIYDDLVVVRTSVSRIRTSAIHFEYIVFNKETRKAGYEHRFMFCR